MVSQRSSVVASDKNFSSISPFRLLWAEEWFFVVLSLVVFALMLGYWAGKRAALWQLLQDPPLPSEIFLQQQVKQPIAGLKFYRQLLDNNADLRGATAVQGRSEKTAQPSHDDKIAVVLPAAATTKDPLKESHPEDLTLRKPTTTHYGLMAGPASTGEFTLQLSAFHEEKEAASFALGLKRQGLQVFVVKRDLGKQHVWYRVRLGRFHSAKSAEETLPKLKQQGISAWVVQED